MTQAPPTIDKHLCDALRKDGRPCRTPALTGASRCFAHDESQAEARQAARRRGGQDKATVRRLSKLMPLRLIPVWEQLEQALSDVLAGELEPKQAAAAASIGRALVAVLSAGELEERLRKLEADQ